MSENMEVKREHTEAEFVRVYTQLCKEYGFTIRPEMSWKKQIDGAFTIAVQLRVEKLQQ